MSSHALRRGLPRVPGGEPWPPAVGAPLAAGSLANADPSLSAPADVTAESMTETARGPVPSAPVVAHASGDVAEPARVPAAVRRGLPRVRGGDPWPLTGETHVGLTSSPAGLADVAAAASRRGEIAAETPAPIAAAEPVAAPVSDRTARRRGLPRTPGNDPWPPTGAVPVASAPSAVVPAGARMPAQPTPTAADHPPVDTLASTARKGLPRPGTTAAAPTPPDSSLAPASKPERVHPALEIAASSAAARRPLAFTPTVWAGAAASGPRAPKHEPRRYGPFTRGQWVGAVIVTGLGLLFAAAMAVFAVRWLVSLDALQDFLATYPGEYHLPVGAPVGFPAWLGWQHFLNTFFILLIIRTGLQVRHQKKPPAFWTPRWNSKRKISLALWFHQSLDILWVLNGVVFIVLLFVTGQWMRIVPTSWEVFPNAVSAALQYVSLDWPTENGWVNYNSLQQIAYFTTVFIAAPLAIVTGVRMSGIWPARARTLNRLFPVELARAVHFPVMLYFVVFIVAHVALVFATGALRNLNHMYGAQDAVNWTGFWIFVGSMVALAAGWVAARPLVLAPIASVFGTVKGR